MVTENGSPSSRTSSGSSTATVSTRRTGPRAPYAHHRMAPRHSPHEQHPDTDGNPEARRGTLRTVAMELSTWLDAVSAELGITDVELDNKSIHTLLDLARDAAHEVERLAAPLTTFLVGVAVGRGATGGAAAR